MINELTLFAGVDIPFPQGRATIHQPTLKEIAFLGEDNFFTGCQVLRFSKDLLSDQDKVNLKNVADFDIILSMIKNARADNKSIQSAMLVLFLLFPQYDVEIREQDIALKSHQQNGVDGMINRDNFEQFKSIISQIFCLESTYKAEYNPQGSLAKRIADKFKKGRQKVAKQKRKQDRRASVFSRYVSILSIGQYKTIQDLMSYTVYQLNDEFKRFELKENYDMYIQAKMAGASGLKDVDNWMKDIHDGSEDD